MSQNDLKQLDDDALRARVGELRGQLAAERYRSAVGGGRKPAAVTNMKRDLARALTLMSQRGVSEAGSTRAESRPLAVFRRELTTTESNG